MQADETLVFERTPSLRPVGTHYCPGCQHGIAHRLVCEVVDELGLAEAIHAANRGERIAVFFRNTTVYGMTGGQMAPTTLIGQVTQTSPTGRKAESAGYPVRMTEMLAHLDGAVYLERVAVNNAPNIKKAKKALRRAFEVQLAGKGFALVEVLAICPTNWRLSAVESNKWLEKELMAYYPLGLIKNSLDAEGAGDAEEEGEAHAS